MRGAPDEPRVAMADASLLLLSTGIFSGMQSGAARCRWRWVVDPIYAASETGLRDRYDQSPVSFQQDFYIFDISIKVVNGFKN